MELEPEEAAHLSEAALIAATGISRRKLVRWRQKGLIPVLTPRTGLGPGGGRGTKPLEYPRAAVETISRLDALTNQFKEIEECRWHLWCEGYSVRIGVDLCGVLDRLKAGMEQVKNLDDVETKLIPKLKPAYMPRGHPLRLILRGLSEEEMHSVTIMVICMIGGIRLPLFDELNPIQFQVFKRVFGLPKELHMPAGFFDAFPYMYEQLRNALLTATADELQGARVACRLMSRLLDEPENSRRGAIVISGAPLPWRPIKLASLMWPSPVMRAATVGLIILGIRGFTAALGAEAAAAFASIASGLRIFFPETRPAGPVDQSFDHIKRSAGRPTQEV